MEKKDGAYVLTVNYDRSVEDGIKAGKYDWANNNITSSHFPSDEAGIKEVSLGIIHFGRSMRIDEVPSELGKMGLRPATLKELLTFGEKYPDLQKEFPVIAPGSIWRDSLGNYRRACLSVSGTKRTLSLSWIGSRLYGNCRFIGVYK